MTDKKQEATDKKNVREVLYNQNLHTVFSDSMNIKRCGESHFVLSFYNTLTDELAEEQARVAVTPANMRKLIDLACRVAKYFPERDDSGTEKTDRDQG